MERPLSSGGSQPVGRLKVVPCTKQWFDAHLWVATWNDTRDKDSGGHNTYPGYIMSDESVCIDNVEGEARAMACSAFSRQLWYHNSRTEAIVHGNSGLCLSVGRTPEPPDEISVHKCDGSSEQQWRFQTEPWN